MSARKLEFTEFDVPTSDEETGGHGDAAQPKFDGTLAPVTTDMAQTAFHQMAVGTLRRAAGSVSSVESLPLNLDTTGNVCSCAFCLKTSSEVRWWVYLEVRSGSITALRADGDMCFKHGSGADTFPLLTQQQLLDKVENTPAFAKDFEEVCARSMRLAERLFKQESVSSRSQLYSEAYLICAAIPTPSFIARWMPPAAFSIKVSPIIVPPLRQPCDCVLVFPTHDVPNDVFHFFYTMAASNAIEMSSSHLSGDRVCRARHAEDTFQGQLSKHEIQTERHFKGGDPNLSNAIVTIKKIEESYKEEQRRLRSAGAVTDAMTAGTMESNMRTSEVVQRVVGGISTAVIDVDASAPAPARRPRMAAGRGESAAPRARRAVGQGPPRPAPVLKAEPGAGGGGDVFGFGGDGSPQNEAVNVSPGVEAEQEEEEPDWHGILKNEGGDLGRELRGADARLDTIPKPSLEYDVAELQLKLLRCAISVKLDKARTVEVDTLKKNVRKLELNNVTFPPECQHVYTMRVINHDLETGIVGPSAGQAMKKWAVSLVWGCEKPSILWEIEGATFDMCQPENEEVATQSKFRRTGHQAVFNDTFVTAWKKSLDDTPGSVDMIVWLARNFLDAFAFLEATIAIEWQTAILTPAMKVMRGILAMNWPMPLAYDCSFVDVLYLIPDKKLTMLTRDVCTVGKLLVSSAAESEAYSRRKQHYKDYTGAEATHGLPLWSLYMRLTTVGADYTVDTLLPFYAETTSHIGEWAQTLRPGAKEIVQNELVHMTLKIADQVSETDHVVALESALKEFTVPGAQQLHTRLMAKAKGAIRQEAVARLDKVLEDARLAPTFEKVKPCLDSVRNAVAQGTKLNSEQMKLATAVFQAFVKQVLQSDKMPVGADEQGFADMPLLIKELHELSKEESVKKVSNAMNTFLSTIVGVKDSEHTLLQTSDYDTGLKVLRPLLDALKNLVKRASEGTNSDQMHVMLNGTPFLRCIGDEFIPAIEHTITKASESLDGERDHKMMKQVEALLAVAGGAPKSARWTDGCATVDGLMDHFDATLNKVAIDQVIDLTNSVSETMVWYVGARADCEDRQRINSGACEALLRARTLQLEMVIFKTIKKSKHIVDRVKTLCSNFDTEVQACGARKQAAACLSPIVVEFLKKKHDISLVLSVAGAVGN